MTDEDDILLYFGCAKDIRMKKLIQNINRKGHGLSRFKLL